MAARRATKGERVRAIARRVIGKVPGRKVFIPKTLRKAKYKDEFEME